MEYYQKDDGNMFLYDSDSKKILVYRLIPREDKFFAYKKEKMKLIPKERQVWEAVTYMKRPVLESYILDRELSRKKVLDSSQLDYCDQFHQDWRETKHSFNPWEVETEDYIKQHCLLDRDELIEKYCRKLGPSLYVKVNDDKKIGICGLILGNSSYNRDFNSGLARKTDIINIPLSLFELELFMDGCFNSIEDCQLEEFLNLYVPIDINKPIWTKEFSEFDELATYFPTTVTLKSVVESNIKSSEKVLRLLKK